MSYWQEKVVLITGGSSGIGRGLALELSRRGATIGLVARRREVLAEIVRAIETQNGHALALPADVQDAAALRKAADHLRTTCGPVDVLVANAGVGGISWALELEPREVANVLNTNVIGAVNSVAAVLPEMVERGQGQLVAISSLSAYRGLAKSGAYCASKAALSIFFESLRLDLRGRGVDVTIVHPGFIKTPLTAGRRARLPFLMEPDDAVNKIIRAVERKRTSYAFPWQLATIVRACMILPDSVYDRIAAGVSLRE